MQQLNSFEEIKACQNPLAVTHIRIVLYRYFNERIGGALKQFKNLKSFECQLTNFFESELSVVLTLPKLERLVLQKGYVAEISYQLTEATGLRILDLSKNYITDIPLFFRDLKELEELMLDGNKISDLDDVLLDLPKLRVLAVNGWKTKEIPDFLLKLIPQLSELSLPKALSAKFIKKHPKLYEELPYLSMNTSLERKWGSKIWQYFYENKTDWDTRAFYFNLLAANESKIRQQASIIKCISAVNFPAVEVIRLKALEYLQGQIPDKAKPTLQKNASILVLGKLGINKNELRQKLKDLNIKYEAKITKATTHCLLGQLPGDMALEAFEKELPLLTEKYILDYWEEMKNPYLLEVVAETPEQADNLAALLMSGQEDSIFVALSMFKEGGFPKALITELYIAYQTLALKSAARNEAERLLRQYGSIELMNHMKPSYLFVSNRNSHSLTTKLRTLDKKTELDVLKIAAYLYAKNKTAIVFLLSELPIEEAVALLRRDFLKAGVLKLTNIGLTSIPPAIFQLGLAVEELNLKLNGIKAVSKEISKLKNLRVLDLRSNLAANNKSKMLNVKLGKLLPNCKLKLGSAY